MLGFIFPFHRFFRLQAPSPFAPLPAREPQSGAGLLLTTEVMIAELPE